MTNHVSHTIADATHSFVFAFRLAKKKFFFVSYEQLGSNAPPHFATSIGVLNFRRTDYDRCGQGQESVLKYSPPAMRFYRKWDAYHCQPLTLMQMEELLEDLETLKQRYPYTTTDKFYAVVEFDRAQSK